MTTYATRFRLRLLFRGKNLNILASPCDGELVDGRVIPCVLISGESAIKTVSFGRRIYLGDPINVLRVFNEKSVDEIIVLDIDASRKGVAPNYDLISRLARECIVPVTYGGGITNVNEVKRILDLGIEKVSIQNAFFARKSFVEEAAAISGAQSIIVSIDLVGMSSSSLRVRSCGVESASATYRNWVEVLKEAHTAGAGELLLNFCDRDGRQCGLDIESANKAAESVSCSIVIMGGANSRSDISRALEVGVSGVGVGAMFLLYGPYDAMLVSYLDDHEDTHLENST